MAVMYAKIKDVWVPLTIGGGSGGSGGTYILPAASASALGGIQADPALPGDTVPVHIGPDNKLRVPAYPEGGETFIELWTNPDPVSGALLEVPVIDYQGYTRFMIVFKGSSFSADDVRAVIVENVDPAGSIKSEVSKILVAVKLVFISKEFTLDTAAGTATFLQTYRCKSPDFTPEAYEDGLIPLKIYGIN